jgi:tripartite-type tricarboxylate transporter receptor subunit TctC
VAQRTPFYCVVQKNHDALLVVHPSNPAKTLQEFVANAKKKSITFGTAGVSTSPYVAAAYFFKEPAKVEAVHVPSRAARRR